MPWDQARARQRLKESKLRYLFIEDLGWNHPHEFRPKFSVDGQEYSLEAVAEKCGMLVFICSPDTQGRIPDTTLQRKIERLVTKSVHEHLIIFTDSAKRNQVWQWVRRETGKPAACRTHRYHTEQSGELLLQKLRNLAFSLTEEEIGPTLPQTTGKVRKGFDVEKMTKRFYDRFKAEHDAFLKFLKGIPDKEMERWYVSVMLNRLMFIYFIQKKGFLNQDTDYLRKKLTESQAKGKDKFYRDYLCPLFFDGFATREEERSDKMKRMLGQVPYLNGGIFMPHQIEEHYGTAIQIPDKAFEKIFEFFETYQWHLDERILRNDREINPDVLGYIFEKYINQKQMGAYYTKEDITGYIGKNTIIPYLFDAARQKCKVAFDGEKPVWKLLQEDPDRYIYDAVKHGLVVDVHSTPARTLEKPLELPANITAGLKDISKRDDWNKPAPPEYALPTEIWREVIERRQRYEEVRGILQRGDIRDINDLITYNLDIRQFAQDVIENCEGPDLLVAFWRAIEKVTVLDPTCGSGAFLFAALNILEPLYEACLDRMEFFVAEWGVEGKKNHPNYYKDFSGVLQRIEEHPNHDYFVFKSIIINNLYGVDIMEEAVEICKLRLFLKLMAQIDRLDQIEPLPDIDFNIKAGNTLVGFATLEEVKKTQEGTLDFGTGEIDRIEEDAALADKAFQRFHEMQTRKGMKPAEFAEAKDDLRQRLKKLNDVLDKFLAKEYGVNLRTKEEFSKWLSRHHPFHWFTEFYGILKEGGFNVIIGNPPYVEYKDIKNIYKVIGFLTEECGDLYSFVMERSMRLLVANGNMGMIVPVSIASTDGFETLRNILTTSNRTNWCLSFAERPSKLFNGVEKRLSIWLTENKSSKELLYLSNYRRWLAQERETLFFTEQFVKKGDLESHIKTSTPKISTSQEVQILKKLFGQSRMVSYFLSQSQNIIYYTRKVRYFVQFFDFIPMLRNSKNKKIEPSELKNLFSHLLCNEMLRSQFLIQICSFGSFRSFRMFVMLIVVKSSCFPVLLIKFRKTMHLNFK